MNGTTVFWAAAALFMAVPTLLDILIKSEHARSRINLLLGMSMLLWGGYSVYEHWPLQKRCIGDAHTGWYHEQMTSLLTSEGWLSVKSYYPLYRGQMLYLAQDRSGDKLLCRDDDGGCVDVLSMATNFHPSTQSRSMELRTTETKFSSWLNDWKITVMALLGLLLVGSMSLNVRLIWGQAEDND